VTGHPGAPARGRRNPRRRSAAGLLAAGWFCLLAGTAGGHEMHGHPAATPPPGTQTERQSRSTRPEMRRDETYQRSYFTDLPLLTQEGREVRFYTDMLKGRLVLISFIYTNCTEICPILMPNLVEIQNDLGDRFGREISFISISVDPEDDTPEVLKAYGEKYGAKPGWTFLTGKKENVDWVVYKLGQYTEDFEDHSMLFLLGDVKNARWVKMRGDMPPDAVTARLLDLLSKRSPHSAP